MANGAPLLSLAIWLPILAGLVVLGVGKNEGGPRNALTRWLYLDRLPRLSREPKEPPVSMDPVIILQSLVTARPYGDYTQDALTPTQLKIAKAHEYSEEEFELLLERMNYDEQRYRTTLKRLEQIRTEDTTIEQRKTIEAENARRMKDFMDNLPNRRKLSCGHIFDRSCPARLGISRYWQIPTDGRRARQL